MTFFASNSAPDTPPPVAETVLSVKEADSLVSVFIFAVIASQGTPPPVAGAVDSVVSADASLTAVSSGGTYTLFAAEGCGDTTCFDNNLE